MRGLFEVLRGLRAGGARRLGDLLRWRCARERTPDWADAIIDMLQGFATCGLGHPLAAAEARESYYAVLRWFDHMACDEAAIRDLAPVLDCLGESPHTPARWSRAELARELEWLAEPKVNIRAQSILTVAEEREGPRTCSCSCCGGGLFDVLHRVIACRPPASLGEEVEVDQLLHTSAPKRLLRRRENDGIVTSVSMVWPTAAATHLVEADHGDIIGHYRRPGPESYDLLDSGAPFGDKEFRAVWEAVRDFAAGRARQP